MEILPRYYIYYLVFNRFNSINYYGVVYKISLIKDENGNDLINGPVIIYTKDRIKQEGVIRIGRATDLAGRIRTYRYESRSGRKKFHFESE